MGFRARFVLAVAISAGWSATAMAQSTVDEYLQRGVALRREGRDADAVTEFENAYRLSATPRTAGQLGLALQASGDWTRGYAMLREALSSPEDPWVVRARTLLDDAIAVADEHVGRVTVVANVEGAEFFLDGRFIATLPMRSPVPILVGRATFEIRATGYTSVRRAIRVRGGESNREVVRLVVAPVGDGATTAANTGARPPGRITVPDYLLPPTSDGGFSPFFCVGLSGAIMGVLLTITGGGFVALRNDTATMYNTNCLGMIVPPECRSLRPQGDGYQSAAIGLFVVGGLLAVGGAAMMVVYRPVPLLRPNLHLGWLSLSVDGYF